MSMKILDCLKRERDICVKNVNTQPKYGFFWHMDWLLICFEVEAIQEHRVMKSVEKQLVSLI